MSSINEDGKLEWMYKNSNEIVDREEYLLGRRLDKNVDSQSNSTATESIPSSIFSLPESNNRVDAIRKIKEDPLEAIREKEREMRKELLKNPIQMKKLQKMIEAQNKEMQDTELKKKKKKKSKKKKKKNKVECENISDSGEELDALLSKKLANFIKKYGKDKIFNSDDDIKEKKDKTKTFKIKEVKSTANYESSSSEESSSSDSENTDSDSSKKKKHKNKDTLNYMEKKDINKKKSEKVDKRSKSSRKRSYSRSESSSDESEEDKKAKLHKNKRKENISRSKEVKEPNYKKSEYRNSSEDKYDGSKPFGLYVPKGAQKIIQEPETSKRHESPKRNSPKDRSSKDRKKDRDSSKEKERDRRNRSFDRRHDNHESKRSYRNKNRSRDREGGGRDRDNRRTGMTDEEKERKLKEMMDNVSWRKDLMEKNSKRHKEQLKKEEGQLQDYDEDFARNQLSKGIYAESVEKRIKSNIHNIQRSAFAMDKHFTKR